MKKSIFIFAIFLSFAFSQKEPKAEAILNAMSEKYQKMTAFKAEFSYTVTNAQGNVSENAKADITVKGEKFRLKTKAQEVFNNRTTVWTYLKDDNEVTITNYDPNDDLNPTKIYSIYKKGYKFKMDEDQKVGGVLCDVIDLEPEKKGDKSSIFKIRLIISKADKTIKSWKIFEKNGKRFEYNITAFTPNFVVNDTYFNFDKSQYPNVEEVDLR